MVQSNVNPKEKTGQNEVLLEQEGLSYFMSLPILASGPIPWYAIFRDFPSLLVQ